MDTCKSKWTILLWLVAGLAITLPTSAQTIYSNGPINGNSQSWGFTDFLTVSDTFNVTNSGATLTGGSLGIWLFPNDFLLSADLSITSGENGGAFYLDQEIQFSQGSCSMNNFGFNVCQENFSLFGAPALNAGTYWLNLTDAQVSGIDAVYWDENSGPSSASQNEFGTIPSESFTLLGTTSSSTTSTSTSTATSVPEPGSILLFASGVLGLAGVLRRKLF